MGNVCSDHRRREIAAAEERRLGRELQEEQERELRSKNQRLEADLVNLRYLLRLFAPNVYRLHESGSSYPAPVWTRELEKVPGHLFATGLVKIIAQYADDAKSVTPSEHTLVLATSPPTNEEKGIERWLDALIVSDMAGQVGNHPAMRLLYTAQIGLALEERDRTVAFYCPKIRLCSVMCRRYCEDADRLEVDILSEYQAQQLAMVIARLQQLNPHSAEAVSTSLSTHQVYESFACPFGYDCKIFWTLRVSKVDERARSKLPDGPNHRKPVLANVVVEPGCLVSCYSIRFGKYMAIVAWELAEIELL